MGGVSSLSCHLLCHPATAFVFINDASVMSPGLLSQRPNNCFTVIGGKRAKWLMKAAVK